jgi:hypothetical protein
MSNPVEVLTNGNMTGKIYYDEDCENPREFYDAYGTMICKHKKYILGDEKASKDFFNGDNEFESWDEVEGCLIQEYNAEVILPFSLYDPSGLSMHIGRCHGWDSGQVGFIYASKEKCIEEFGKDFSRDKIVKLLESEVEEYDNFLRGECYYFVVTRPKIIETHCPHCNELIGTEEVEEIVDSCSGMIGQKYVLEEVKSIMGIKDGLGV